MKQRSIWELYLVVNEIFHVLSYHDYTYMSKILTTFRCNNGFL